MNIGNVIYKLRNCRGMTEENLAEALNVTKETVTRWEKGNREPQAMTSGKFYIFCEKNNIRFEK